MKVEVKLWLNIKTWNSDILLFCRCKIGDDLTKGSNASFYIIAGVFAFGLLVFLISKIASKYTKEDEKNERNNIRHISHRHHHHRVVKKSA